MKNKIEVFGAGCAKCKALHKSAQKAINELNLTDETEIVYITDMDKIVDRGIFSTPALAYNGKIIVSGRYLPPNKLVQLFKER